MRDSAVSLPSELPDLDWRRAPALPGVALIMVSGGEPYLGRTRNIQRRMKRLLAVFGARARSASFEATGSPFETDLTLWRHGRLVWPDEYRRRLRLRPAPLVKLHLANAFPRTSVTTRLGGRRALYFGPFVDRGAAERFEQDALDFFGVRRCIENLEPDPLHPGCVWGEMGKCLRPCQAEVSAEEYRQETGKLLAALESDGAALAEALQVERDQASEDLEFERAARLHEKVAAARKLFGTEKAVARDLDRLHGIMVQRGAADSAGSPDSVALLPIYRGCWQSKISLDLKPTDGKAPSLDARLREALEAASFREGDAAERQDSISLLRRWNFSSWRQGELIELGAFDRIPYRRLVNSVSRVVQAKGSR